MAGSREERVSIERVPLLSLEDGQLLRAVPWTELRPGVSIKRLERGDYQIVSRTWFCQDCLTQDRGLTDYMVKDELWKQACPKDGILCYPCLEKRLGRALTPEDLSTNAPMNKLLFHLIAGVVKALT